MDLSAKFEKSSIHGNYYQMAIIDVKSKYVWDFYLETKDQVYPMLKEWLETEIAAHRGRDLYKTSSRSVSSMGYAERRREAIHQRTMRS